MGEGWMGIDLVWLGAGGEAVASGVVVPVVYSGRVGGGGRDVYMH